MRRFSTRGRGEKSWGIINMDGHTRVEVVRQSRCSWSRPRTEGVEAERQDVRSGKGWRWGWVDGGPGRGKQRDKIRFNTKSKKLNIYNCVCHVEQQQ